jgi:hypothetical protein
MKEFVGHGIICHANQSCSKRSHEMLLRNLSIISIFALQPMFAQVEPKAGTWSTWVVSSMSQVRLPPPAAVNTAAEIQAIKSLMALYQLNVTVPNIDPKYRLFGVPVAVSIDGVGTQAVGYLGF